MAAAGRLRRIAGSDVAQAFLASPTAMAAAAVFALYLLAAAAPGLLAGQAVFDLTQISLRDAFKPPMWLPLGELAFPLGSDDQGRDVLSAIVYGIRVSMLVGLASVALSVTIGVALGLIAGYFGGVVDAVIMRVADIQLTFPAILIAVIVDGIARLALTPDVRDALAAWVLVVAIALSGWVQYARTVRGVTLSERNREYVQAARVIGLPVPRILLRHILPNTLTAVLVIATIHLAVAIILEATLSFVGLGVPPTQPSLGTLIRIGNAFLFSGEWWIAIFPGLALVLLVLAVNLLGDWLRDVLNPRLR